MRLIVFLFFICAGNTFAGALYCGGKVEKLGLHASDQIMLKLSSMNQAVFICSPNKKWTVVGAGYTTSAEMCSSILSMLMHAKATNTTLDTMLFDGDNVPSNCTSWQSWKKANIRYFLY
ncbi:MAG: hypothetical protein HRU24_15565 [Gammaproteobacteria bacterium]|nr:hypothetical protein [Gammaproteobacteria bacterium]